MDPARLPWPLLLAAASLVTIVLAYLARPDVFRKFGFGREEVALLTLGAVAGWAVNLPVVPLGSSFLAFNLGGALLSLFLTGLWIVRRRLPLLRAALGVALVAFLTHGVVRFVPDQGILAPFPWFFIPPAAAFLWATTVCLTDLRKAVPVAFVSGSVGALVGADLLNIPAIHDHFVAAQGQGYVVSVGGAGVFDMVFLAGVMPMALGVLVLAVVFPRAAEPALAYPAAPWEIGDDRAAWRAFSALPDANPLERGVASLALSNQALEEGDFSRSIRMSYLAVDALLGAGQPPLRERLPTFPLALASDLAALAAAYHAARERPATREEAGAANRTAKLVLGALGPASGLRSRLEAA